MKSVVLSAVNPLPSVQEDCVAISVGEVGEDGLMLPSRGVVKAVVVSPLTDLSPKVDFLWSESCQRALDSAKALLISAPVLSAPDFSMPFQLAVDASDWCGCCPSSSRP